jgi:hypothetical protein
MKLMLTLKRRSGFRVIEYIDERGRDVIRVPLGAWRAPRRGIGGIPHGGASQIARLAAGMLVDARPCRRDVFDIDLGVAQRYRVHLDSGGDPCTAAAENLPALLMRRVEKI